jgi:hypothetical protein
MPLFDAIVDANHRALAGDTTAGIRPGDLRPRAGISFSASVTSAP